ncbi:hypothetical protein [Amycolatopsis cihanbeyliensis]|uniref:Uncharacterized protein n=1 Tax=Amycolatopsis cihanbeyliensis TaxID=1128664 RepID=A0A542DPV2_AMYCI|nr:hypothetical protein [Amycolatopsis cihanbeyliensis]TQJ05129.1 hypothetical protein FB471_4953 [Amycolatopsis cihanbeyliensis]
MNYHILREFGELILNRPCLGAPPAEVAAWYERKADLFECIAAAEGHDPVGALRQARLARRHASRLVTAGSHAA